MSDYCAGCRYDVKQAVGSEACPFNFLYWDFLARHRDKLRGNPRMGLVYKSMEGMDPERLATMRAQAAGFLEDLT
jgi:deoxyribodipyrimidine photolyase-related protein